METIHVELPAGEDKDRKGCNYGIKVVKVQGFETCKLTINVPVTVVYMVRYVLHINFALCVLLLWVSPPSPRNAPQNP